MEGRATLRLRRGYRPSRTRGASSSQAGYRPAAANSIVQRRAGGEQRGAAGPPEQIRHSQEYPEMFASIVRTAAVAALASGLALAAPVVSPADAAIRNGGGFHGGGFHGGGAFHGGGFRGGRWHGGGYYGGYGGFVGYGCPYYGYGYGYRYGYRCGPFPFGVIAGGCC
jgi:hypothetical protein